MRVWSQVVLTKRKDDEQTSSTIYNAMDHRNPVLDFQDYLKDDEDVVDQVSSNSHLAGMWSRSRRIGLETVSYVSSRSRLGQNL